MSANMHTTSPAYSRSLNPQYQAILLLVGRILVALIFVWFGYLKLTNWDGSIQYFTKWGFAWAPTLGATLAVIFELGGGILLVIGWKTRWVAAALFVYLIAATLIVHTYWTYDAAQRFNQMSHFYKNVAIMGAMFFLAAVGPGRYSVDKS
jgi:putative oxidoreductase